MSLYKPIRILLFVLVSAGAASCAPRAETAGKGAQESAPTSSAAQQAPSQAASPATAPEAAAASALSAAPDAEAVEGLRRLGFTVFEKPQSMPDFTARTLEGKPVTLKDYAGKVVFLNFWATWCPPCRAEMPSIQKMYDAVAGEDFGVLAISVGETPDTVRDFLKKTPYSFPIALDADSEFSDAFVGRGIPTTYILDREGRAIAGIIGGREWDTEEAVGAFRRLSSGR